MLGAGWAGFTSHLQISCANHGQTRVQCSGLTSFLLSGAAGLLCREFYKTVAIVLPDRYPLIPFLPARSPSVQLSLSALSWLTGPTMCLPPWVWFGCLEPSKAWVGWLNIVLAGWLGPSQRPLWLLACCQWGSESSRRGRTTSTGALGPPCFHMASPSMGSAAALPCLLLCILYLTAGASAKP